MLDRFADDGQRKRNLSVARRPGARPNGSSHAGCGHWGWVVDRLWNLVYVTEDQRLTYGVGTAIDLPLGGHFLGPELLAAFQRSTYGANTTALLEHQLRSLGGLALADVGGDREVLRAAVAPDLRHIVDELEPNDRMWPISNSRGPTLTAMSSFRPSQSACGTNQDVWSGRQWSASQRRVWRPWPQ